MLAAGTDTLRLGTELPLWSVLPFALNLLSIALLPLAAPRFWHRHFPKVALFWALVLGVPFVIAYGTSATHAISHVLVADYVPFLVLLIGLFTVTGGIVVRGGVRGTPAGNTALLLAGTLLASWIGTTGASMILVRPLIAANAKRRHRVHTVVFFIFLVSNIGGVLTPLGDPPLFLGFLHGVPFFWTLRLIRELGIACALLLPAFFVLDTWYWRREDPALRDASRRANGRMTIAGDHNLGFLALIVGAVLLSGLWKPGTLTILGVERGLADLVRDALILLAAAGSLLTTPLPLRRENEFSWGPVREVAYLFAGIFVTMIPALEILAAGASGPLGAFIRPVQTPQHFFWATGMLSSFLDNAPTYLSFYTSALGKFYPGLPEPAALHGLLTDHGRYLEAISAGAVFMGANSYIGNAPNFMVKTIAEEAGVRMPSFFGYIVCWTVPFLLPVFVVVTLLA